MPGKKRGKVPAAKLSSFYMEKTLGLSFEHSKVPWDELSRARWLVAIDKNSQSLGQLQL